MSRRRNRGSSGIFTTRRVLIGLGIVVLLVILAPLIIAKTPLRQQIVSWAAPDLKAEVEIGSANLWWFSPIVMNDLVVKDETGQKVVSAGEISVEKTLLSLILDTSDIGKIRVVDPEVHVALREDGSNLEDLLAPFMNSDEESSSSMPIQVEIENGAVHVAANDQTWSLEKVSADIDMPASNTRPILVELACVVANAAADPHAVPGTLEGDFSWKTSSEPDSLGDGHAHFACHDFPLGIIGPVASRLGVQVETSGELNADAKIVAEEAGHLIEINQFAANNVAVRAPEYLGDETLQLTQIQADGTAHLNGARLEMDEFQIRSPIASLVAHGGMDVTVLSTHQILDALQHEDYEIEAQADLAAIAKLIPATLSIREGTEIQSGSAQLRVVSRVQGGSRRVVAAAETRDLRALNNGKVVSWSQPVRLDVAANMTPSGPVIENLKIDSNFLNVTGRGDLNQGRATLNGDLDRLAAELGQFVDLSSYQLAGQMDGEVTWAIQQQNDIQANAKVTLTNFAVTLPDSKPWREKNLYAEAGAALSVSGGSIQRIDSATARLVSADDMAEVVLAEPIVNPSFDSACAVRLKLAGATQTWLPRVQNWAPVSEIDLVGQINAELTGRVSSRVTQIDTTRIELLQCKGQAYGLTFDEPRLLLEGAGAWNQDTQVFASENITLASSTVSLRGSNLSMNASTLAMAGDVAYRCDLNRLNLMLSDRKTPPTQRVAGEASGSIRLTHDDGVTAANANADVANVVVSMLNTVETPGVFAVSHRTDWQPVWEEPAMKLTFNGQYSDSNDRLQIFKADLASQSISATMAGDLLQATSQAPTADVKGKISYDLGRLIERFRTMLGDNVQVVGRGVRDFYVTGPIWPEKQSPGAAPKLVSDKLKAGASVAWQGANVYGMIFSEGVAEAQLAGGVVNILPIRATVSEGRFDMSAKLPLNQQPLTLHANGGRVVDNVRLSPEMCRTWMKYLAPILADATSAEGRFSVTLADAKMPVMDPYAATAKGTMKITNGQVGPGPLGQKVLGTAGQINGLLAGKPLGGVLNTASGKWLGLPQQTVPFEVADNKVRHADLEVITGDVLVSTAGTVGYDQSLDIIAKAQLRNGARQGQPIADAFRGKQLVLPIKGTASRPQIDTSGLKQLATQMAQAAVKKNVQQNIGNVIPPNLNPANLPKPSIPKPNIQKATEDIKNKADDLKDKAGKAINDQINKGFKSIFGR